MKYINADKLIAEVERRKEKWLAESRLIRKGKDKAMYAAGKSSGYTEFLSLIDSLQQEQKPAEWSEEDEKMLASFLHKVEVCDLLTNKENAWIVERLKSLRPSWKPSEEQMGTLKRWLKDHEFDGDSRYVYPIFYSLLTDLQKLLYP